MEVLNWRRVEPGICSAGQPRPQEWPAIAQAGIKTVINLRPDDEQPGVDEAALVQGAGLAYFHLPIASAADLTADRVSRFAELVAQHGAGGLLVHCGSGNRVGALFALQRAREPGVTVDEAIAYGRGAGLSGLTARVVELLAAGRG